MLQWHMLGRDGSLHCSGVGIPFANPPRSVFGERGGVWSSFEAWLSDETRRGEEVPRLRSG